MSPLLAALSLLALCWQPAGAVPRIVESLHYQSLGACIAKDHQPQVYASIAPQAKAGDEKIPLEQVPSRLNLMLNTMMLACSVADGAMDKNAFLQQSPDHGMTCEPDDPKLNEVLSSNVGGCSVANKMDLLRDEVDSDANILQRNRCQIFNCALVFSHVLSAVCMLFLSRLLAYRNNRIRIVSRVRNLSHRKLQKKLKGYDCIDRLGLHLKVLLSSSLTNVRSRRWMARSLEKGVVNASFQQFTSRKKSRAVHRGTSKALYSIIEDYFKLLSTERDTPVLIKLLNLVRKLYGDLTYPILENRACNYYLRIMRIIEKNENVHVRFTALEVIYYYFFDFMTDELANRTVEVFLVLVAGFRARNGRLLGDASIEAPRKCWEEGRHEEAEILRVFRMLRLFIDTLGAQHLAMLCSSEDLMRVIFDGLANEAEMDERMEEYFLPSLTAITLANLLRYASAADRASLREKYEVELAMALMKLDFQELTNAMHHDDTISYVVRKSILFNHVIHSIKNADLQYEMGQRYTLSVALLGYGLRTGPHELERMLGLDLLRPAARFLAHQALVSDREEAIILSEVLHAHPEWNKPFRIATVPGNPSSHIALLGLTIPQRRSNPALYIFLDEDNDDI